MKPAVQEISVIQEPSAAAWTRPLVLPRPTLAVQVEPTLVPHDRGALPELSRTFMLIVDLDLSL